MCSEEIKKEQELSDQVQEKDVVSCNEHDCADMHDKLLRVTADFQNYRSRIEKDRTHSLQLGQISVLTKLLTIVDNLDRAIDETKKKDSADISWIAGFELIVKSLYQLLADYGVRPIEQIITFDPELHEALAQIDSPSHESGAVVEVMQKGFMFGSRVLRPAKVTVAK